MFECKSYHNTKKDQSIEHKIPVVRQEQLFNERELRSTRVWCSTCQGKLSKRQAKTASQAWKNVLELMPISPAKNDDFMALSNAWIIPAEFRSFYENLTSNHKFIDKSPLPDATGEDTDTDED